MSLEERERIRHGQPPVRPNQRPSASRSWVWILVVAVVVVTGIALWLRP